MTILFVVLIVLASVILGLIVLIQNPKGGGLAGSFAGVSSQFMGVKQTNDVLEKGTWIFAVAIMVLSLTSTFFISGRTSSGANGRLNEISTSPVQQQAPSNNAVPFPAAPVAPAKADSGK
ncbi:MAG: preprotein translocase subunit SecG [Niabella sp.]